MALVGDAGHGVTPNLGQGCNAALETVAILDKVESVLPSCIRSFVTSAEQAGLVLDTRSSSLAFVQLRS